MEYIRKKIKYLSMISYNINNEITTPNVRNESYIQILTDLKADLEKIDKNNPELKLEDLKKKNTEILRLFKNNKKHNEWSLIISIESNYDWWAFPIPDPDPNKGGMWEDPQYTYSGKGKKYSVFLKDIDNLRFEESPIIANIKEIATIVCEAWGWDLDNNRVIYINPLSEQTRGWRPTNNIRLFKMILSLLCFGFIKEANSAIQFGKTIDLNYIDGVLPKDIKDYRYLFV